MQEHKFSIDTIVGLRAQLSVLQNQINAINNKRIVTLPYSDKDYLPPEAVHGQSYFDEDNNQWLYGLDDEWHLIQSDITIPSATVIPPVWYAYISTGTDIPDSTKTVLDFTSSIITTNDVTGTTHNYSGTFTGTHFSIDLVSDVHIFNFKTQGVYLINFYIPVCPGSGSFKAVLFAGTQYEFFDIDTSLVSDGFVGTFTSTFRLTSASSLPYQAQFAVLHNSGSTWSGGGIGALVHGIDIIRLGDAT